MPALRLAAFDLERGAIKDEQQGKVRQTVVTVISAISGGRRGLVKRRHALSMLGQMSAGRELRQQREALIGRWQGPLSVPPGSIMLCVSLGSMLDDLATELLVRILRDKKLDARHLSLEDLGRDLPPEAVPDSVSMVFLVSGAPGAQRSGAESAAARIRERTPRAALIAVFLPGLALPREPAAVATLPGADRSAGSLGEALEICLQWLDERSKG